MVNLNLYLETWESVYTYNSFDQRFLNYVGEFVFELENGYGEWFCTCYHSENEHERIATTADVDAEKAYNDCVAIIYKQCFDFVGIVDKLKQETKGTT